MKHDKLVKALVVIAVFCFSLAGSSLAQVENFPYRSQYPEVRTISTQELYQKDNSGDIIIVDVRSKIEYEVIHPVGTVHIPIGHLSFIDKVTQLTKENPGKEIAFYCNGITCLKSYEATKKALAGGFKNCFAYDAGIPAWAETYPDKTLLLGKIIVDPEKQIIPKAEFKKLCLLFEDFKQKSDAPDAVVIDVRDFIQKSGKLPGLETALEIPLDKFIPNFVEKKVDQDKTLFIFDQVGKQVRWLMYYVVENGYTNYYFLDKGATGVLKEQKYKQ